MKKISLFKTKIHEEAFGRVEGVLKSGWVAMGPYAEEFERKFKEEFCTPNALVVNSGTAALHMACALVGDSPIVTTPLTFIATNIAIKMAGLQLKFVDIDPETGNIDPAKIPHDGIGAVMAVHYGGLPCDMTEIEEAGGGVPIIQDAAHSMGAKYKGQHIGSFGDYVCFSMNSRKNVPSGDGGVLVVPQGLEEKARRMRWFGADKTTWQRAGGKYSWYYEVNEMGFKYDIPDILCAIALTELEHHSDNNYVRAMWVNEYRRLLGNVPGVTLLARPSDRKSANHLMVIKVEDRDKLGEKLNAHNIDFGVHYTPNNCYKVFGGSEKKCRKSTPNAWEFYQKCMSLPLHLDLTLEDLHYICKVIRGGW